MQIAGTPRRAPKSVVLSQANLNEVGEEEEIQEVVMDKGYHSTELLAQSDHWGLRTYLPDPKRKRRKWKDKAPELEQAYRGAIEDE